VNGEQLRDRLLDLGAVREGPGPIATPIAIVAPMYLLTADPAGIIGGFFLHGCYAGAICGRNPSYLTGRFPTEVRSTAAGFCYHQGAGGFVVPILTCLAPVSVLVSE
jgi:hypothetical protein